MIDNEKYSLTLPGRIVTFDAATQTATVQISIDKVFSNSLGVSENATREPIKNVPVHTDFGGGWSMTHPIKPGDTCKVSFSQVGYDHWLWEDKDTAGTLDSVPKPWLKRQFSEDDGFCQVGYNTLPRAIQSYSPDNSEWRNADATQIIRLKDDTEIEIETTSKVTIIAPAVDVQCDTANVDATNSITATCLTADITASTSTTVTTPLLDLICTNMVNITSPLVSQSGNMTIGGTLLVGMGIGGGGAPVPAAGLAVTGPAAVSGPVTASEVTAGTTVLTSHEHGGDGGTGSGASTGAPL